MLILMLILMIVFADADFQVALVRAEMVKEGLAALAVPLDEVKIVRIVENVVSNLIFVIIHIADTAITINIMKLITCGLEWLSGFSSPSPS